MKAAINIPHTAYPAEPQSNQQLENPLDKHLKQPIGWLNTVLIHSVWMLTRQWNSRSSTVANWLRLLRIVPLTGKWKHLWSKLFFSFGEIYWGSSINTFSCNLIPSSTLNTCQSLFIPHLLNTATFKAASYKPQDVSQHSNSRVHWGLLKDYVL